MKVVLMVLSGYPAFRDNVGMKQTLTYRGSPVIFRRTVGYHGISWDLNRPTFEHERLPDAALSPERPSNDNRRR